MSLIFLLLFEQFSDDKKLIEKFNKEYKNGKIKYSELKPILAESIIEKLKPIRERRNRLAKNPAGVIKILKEGTEKGRKVAIQTLKEVRQAMRLNYFD